jgi:hypothetical protein
LIPIRARALVSFREAYTSRRPRPTCLTRAAVERSNDSIEITLPYTLASYHSPPPSVAAANNSALKKKHSARLLHLCPGLNIAHYKVLTAAGSIVDSKIPCIRTRTLCAIQAAYCNAVCTPKQGSASVTLDVVRQNATHRVAQDTVLCSMESKSSRASGKTVSRPR